MADVTDRLYDNYVSTGQAANVKSIEFKLKDYPYFDNVIKKHLPKNKKINILDIGCGHGSLLFCLNEHGYGNVLGIDRSKEQVEIAKSHGINNIVCSDFNDYMLSVENSIDVIFMMDVLEHFNVKEILNILDNMYKSLRPGGMVIAHIPNAEGIFGMRSFCGDLTHKTCFTPQSIKQGFNVCNFKDIRCYEDSPIVYNSKSFIRYIIWSLGTLFPRLLLAAETGSINTVLSQNMLVVAKKF